MAIENSLKLALRAHPARPAQDSKPERAGSVNRLSQNGDFGWKARPYGLDQRPASA